MIENDYRQFDRRFDNVRRYVENLVSGQFFRVQKDASVHLQREERQMNLKETRY